MGGAERVRKQWAEEEMEGGRKAASVDRSFEKLSCEKERQTLEWLERRTGGA